MAEKKITTKKKRPASRPKATGGRASPVQVEAPEELRPSLKKRFADLDPEILTVGRYLEIHPGVCFGKLIFKGTRVPAEGGGWGAAAQLEAALRREQ